MSHIERLSAVTSQPTRHGPKAALTSRSFGTFAIVPVARLERAGLCTDLNEVFRPLNTPLVGARDLASRRRA
jgi:hypothetical protein